MAITFGFIAVLLLVGFVSMYPNIKILPMVIVGGLIVVIVPTGGYAISYTLWTAIDIAMHPLDAADVAEAELALSAAAPGFDWGSETG
jgi:hypothetical protein